MELRTLLSKLFEILLGKKTKELPELVNNEENRFTITEKIFEKPKPNHIICNGEPIEIDWHKVILWDDEGGLKCEPSQYEARTKSRKVKMFLVHWDACLSSRQMSGVLKERGLSIAFAIDNDGTIYQLMDTKHVAWHARGVNTASVGVEITNAVKLRYQKWYVENGFGKRPLIASAKLNGEVLPAMLGFYPIQVEALQALIKSVCTAHGIPLEVPLDSEGKLVAGVDSRVHRRAFRGIVGHYHVTTAKQDPAGLPLKSIVEEIR